MTAKAEDSESILVNGDFETDSKGKKWPDGWSKPQGVSWEEEDGKHFIRLVAQTPGETLMVYKELDIPPATAALEITIRYRTAGVQKGAQSWFDARTMFQFMDSDRKELQPTPSPLVFSLESDAWSEKTQKIKVPEGAAMLKLMPCLFQVESGTLDIDEIVIKPVDESAAQ